MRALEGKFSEEFLTEMPRLEQMMTSHHIDPDDFIIAKQPQLTGGYGLPMSTPYMVTVKGQSFTVSMENDMQFLDYFYQICFPNDETPQTHSKDSKLHALLLRFAKWLSDEPRAKE